MWGSDCPWHHARHSHTGYILLLRTRPRPKTRHQRRWWVHCRFERRRAIVLQVDICIGQPCELISHSSSLHHSQCSQIFDTLVCFLGSFKLWTAAAEGSRSVPLATTKSVCEIHEPQPYLAGFTCRASPHLLDINRQLIRLQWLDLLFHRRNYPSPKSGILAQSGASCPDFYNASDIDRRILRHKVLSSPFRQSRRQSLGRESVRGSAIVLLASFDSFPQ